MKYLKLFLTMLKIGLFTFGGGYAMISLLENEFVEKNKYIDKDEFVDMVAIAESTPGPIAINSATYIGYKNAGVFGSALSTLGVALPSFLIIYVISLFFDKFLEISFVASAFKGIQVCVVFLIFSAGIKMLKQLKKTPLNVFVFTASILLMISFSLLSVKFSSILYVIISATIALVAYMINTIISRKTQEKGNKEVEK